MFTSIKHTKKGFTLIELLVVIAIIGILSSVVLASLSTARQKSRDAKRVSDVGQIQLALELFFDASQTYPSTTLNTSDPIGYLATVNFLPKKPVPPNGGSANYIYYGVTSATTVTDCTGAVTSCLSYLVGVNLERADNAVLATDADVTLGTAFYGANTCTANTGAETCYDLRP